MLTSNNIGFYLLEHGLVTPSSIVDGDFMVVEITSRNRNFKVIRRHDPGYFVKQALNWEPQPLALFEREARFYQFTAHQSDLESVSSLLPQFYRYDQEQKILILGLLADGENLSDYHRRLKRFPVETGVQLGRALGLCHQAVPAMNDGQPEALFPKTVPWILSADQLGNLASNAPEKAHLQVLGIIQRYPDFHNLLAALREQWQGDSLIHGDIKWDNCILYGDANNGLQVKLVDWETADLGDAGWDTGAIFQAYLTFWIMSIPVTNDRPVSQLVELAEYPIEMMQPAVHAFWATYCETRQLNPEVADDMLSRSIRYGAARMLQTAYEYMYYSPQMTANALYLLQVSLNILKYPEEAISDLLGF